MRLDSCWIKFHSPVDVATAITITAAWEFVRFQPVDLTLDASLTALTSVGITVSTASTAAHLPRYSQLTALVLLHRVNLLHASRLEHHTTLSSRQRLKKSISFAVAFGKAIFAYLIFTLRLITRRETLIEFTGEL